MHGEVLSRDVARDGHRIEYFHEEIVHFDIEALQDFVSESERLSHVPRLVISSEHDHIAGEVLLDREEKYAYLNAKNTAIDIVTEEQVIQ